MITPPILRRDVVSERWRGALAGAGPRRDARLGVEAQVLATVLHLCLSEGRRIARRRDALVRAATAAVSVGVGALTPPPGRPDHPAAGTRAVDLTRPIVTAGQVLIAEIVILLFEWTFWNATWSEGVSRSAAWYAPERLSVALLALITPLLGILGARLGGGLLHRIVKDHEGIGRFERLGALSGTVLAVLAAASLFWLSRWRFDEGAGLGAVTVPATAMATVFALVVVLDVLLRTFGVSELDDQRRDRDRQTRRGRRRAVRGHSRARRAEYRWVRRWEELRSEVGALMDRVDSANVTGELLVIEAALADGGPDTLRADRAVPSHRDEGLPAGRRQLVVVGDHHVPFEVRLVEDAVAVLRRYLPPEFDGADRLTGIRERLAGHASPPDDAPVDLRSRLQVHRLVPLPDHVEPSAS